MGWFANRQVRVPLDPQVLHVCGGSYITRVSSAGFVGAPRVFVALKATSGPIVARMCCIRLLVLLATHRFRVQCVLHGLLSDLMLAGF